MYIIALAVRTVNTSPRLIYRQLMTLTDEWLTRIKATMSIDLARGMTAGIPPAALVELLWKIPEVEQAFAMRADRRTVPPAVILSDAADYLDDGFPEYAGVVADLRELAASGDLEPKPSAE